MVDNALLITIDSLRADALDDEVPNEPLAPTMKRLSRTGAAFSEAVANGPSTPSSFPSILTGTHPLAYGGYRYLDESRPFVARAFADAGYDTVAYHSNPFLGADHNYDVGFSVFNDSAEGGALLTTLKDSVASTLDPDSTTYRLLRRLWHQFSQRTDSAAYAKAPTITDNAVEWLQNERGDDTPFFMWLHYMDVHYPFVPPSEVQASLGYDPVSTSRVASLNGRMQEDPESLSADDVETLRALYRSELHYVDRHLGRLVKKLEDLDLFDDTAVVVTADHGEGFGEHGRFGHHPHLYDELLRVPLIASLPDEPSTTVDTQVPLLDIGPTLYDTLDIPVPEGTQGQSLLPAVRGEPFEDRPAFSAAGDGDYVACRTSDWKYYRNGETGGVELYHLAEDPGESENVRDEHQDTHDRLAGLVDDHLRSMERTDQNLPDIEESAESRRRLRDLGYLE